MADSPLLSAPLTTQEKPILDKLLQIRDKLLLLKQDKSTYVKSADVLPLYEQVIDQGKSAKCPTKEQVLTITVHLLNDLRDEKHLIQNRVDTVLDDSFQLISLFFLTIGRNNEAPALYSLTSSITRLCEHLKEAAFYSTKDLDGLQYTLDNMERSLAHGKETYSPYLLDRIRYRLKICQGLLQGLRDFLKTLSPEMEPTWEKLVSILRSIAALNTRSKFSLKDLNELRAKLREVETHMQDGKLLDDQGHASGGQDLVVPLLKRCFMFSDVVEQKQGKIDGNFQETYDKLIQIRNHLEKLTMTQAWSLRETDLYMWQRKLDRIDDSRRDGNFFDAEGHPADLHAQRVSPRKLLLELLLTTLDPPVSVATELRIHLPAPDCIRASIGSFAAHLQSAFDSATVLG